MTIYSEHPITRTSFGLIDQEVGSHHFTAAEYAVVRRVVHTTADFDFMQLMRFSGQPFSAAMRAFQKAQPIITDVSMVAAGIGTVAAKTWQSPVVVAVQQAAGSSPAQTPSVSTLPVKTRSADGMRVCARAYPEAIFAVGNAPTALLALCEGIANSDWRPALVIGAPVGFVNVVESKQALAELAVPHILVTGRKGGSAVAAAILNALMIWAWEQSL
ncbi:MAG: precorrin-8X methylmutase [Phormidesmis sp.]